MTLPEKVSHEKKDYPYKGELSVLGVKKIHYLEMNNYGALYWIDYNKNEIIPAGFLKLPTIFDDFL